MRINNPPQLFFLSDPQLLDGSRASMLEFASYQNSDLMNGSINLELFLMGKNHIRIRLENLEDIFDI
jgi:hypothetical protein